MFLSKLRFTLFPNLSSFFCSVIPDDDPESYSSYLDVVNEEMLLRIAVILNLFQDLILFNCAMTIEEEVLLAWIILYKNFSLLFCIAQKTKKKL